MLQFTMFWIKVSVLLFLTFGLISSERDDDENRAYEFGFTIDGQQHRHESKDVNGIIQGEFGFITADGIYHTTVYATDENGSFKILSMRSVRVSPPLDQLNGTYTGPTQGINPTQDNPAQDVPAVPNAPPAQQKSQMLQVKTTRRPDAFTTKPTLRPACGGCGVPLPTTKSPRVTDDLASSKPLTSSTGAVDQSLNPQSGNNLQGEGLQNAALPISDGRFKEAHSQAGKPAIAAANEIPASEKTNSEGKFSNQERSENVSSAKESRTKFKLNFDEKSAGGKQSSHKIGDVERQEHKHDEGRKKIQNQAEEFVKGNHDGTQEAKSKISLSDGVINVPNGPPIPIRDKYPGMVDGLPLGVKEGDVLDLLYKFNYTVGFHGHYERGLKDGSKIGGYFVNGRDGISRVVTYVADEYGYRPKFKLVNLGLDSPDTPKEESEKTFGLKNFEFVWYPVK